MGEHSVTAAARIAETAVSAIQSEVDYHKRLSRQHQAAARAAKQRQNNIIRQCQEAGIHVEIVQSQERGREHGNTRTP